MYAGLVKTAGLSDAWRWYVDGLRGAPADAVPDAGRLAGDAATARFREITGIDGFAGAHRIMTGRGCFDPDAWSISFDDLRDAHSDAMRAGREAYASRPGLVSAAERAARNRMIAARGLTGAAALASAYGVGRAVSAVRDATDLSTI